MSRKWKPGDVGIWSLGMRSELAFRVRHGSACAPHEGPRGRDDHWHLADGTWSDASASLVRPLVVIDPEDSEVVALLWHAASTTPSAFQAALREYANPTPPKPDEPQGLGAVVEDAAERLWVRSSLVYMDPWVCQLEGWRKWDQIDAVKVHSQGVTP